jgi:hypothetical protein
MLLRDESQDRNAPRERTIPAGPCGPNRDRFKTKERALVALLLDLGLLAAEVAEVVQLGATNVTAGDDLDVVDDR